MAGANSCFKSFFIVLSIFLMVSNRIFFSHELKGEVFSSLMSVYCCWWHCSAVAWHPLPSASISELISIPALLKYSLHCVPKSNTPGEHITLLSQNCRLRSKRPSVLGSADFYKSYLWDYPVNSLESLLRKWSGHLLCLKWNYTKANHNWSSTDIPLNYICLPPLHLKRPTAC